MKNNDIDYNLPIPEIAEIFNRYFILNDAYINSELKRHCLFKIFSAAIDHCVVYKISIRIFIREVMVINNNASIALRKFALGYSCPIWVKENTLDELNKLDLLI